MAHILALIAYMSRKISQKYKKKYAYTHPSIGGLHEGKNKRSPGWARTNDLVINSHPLFRLSYQRFDVRALSQI